MTQPPIPQAVTPAGAANVSQSVVQSGAPLIPRAAFNTTTTRELAEAMTDPPTPGSVNRRWGIVHAINDAPDFTLDVTMGGIIVPGLAYDAAYVPTIGEVVMLDVVGGDTVVIGTTVPAFAKTGTLEPSFLPTAKPGSIICQGQTLDRTKYANLWAWANANGLVGTGLPFGPGNGTTTFTIPDLRGRTPIGAGTVGTTTYHVGDLPGSATQTLTTAQMPAHNHNVSVAAHATHNHNVSVPAHAQHSHGGNSQNAGSHAGHFPAVQQGFSVPASSGTYVFAGVNDPGTTLGSHNHNITNDGPTTHTVNESTTGPTTHGVSQDTVGGTTPVNVVQPAFVVNWLIWY